jgi:hypothetical protein
MSRPVPPSPFRDPGEAIGVILELIGRCWQCDAPLERLPSGWCLITHAPGCPLAAEVERRSP